MSTIEITTVERKFKGFDSCTLKYIAIICMLIDHIAWTFVESTSPLGMAMHILGRFTAPIMCFFIAEGFYKTSNVKKYAVRLGVFAIISAPAYILCFDSYLIGVIYTLFLGLMALIVYKSKLHTALKVLAIIAIILLSLVGDWPIFGVLFVLAFGIFYGNFKKQSIAFLVVYALMCIPDIIGTIMMPTSSNIAITLINLCVFLPLFLLYFYNGKRGGENHKSFNKWLFYIFYPAHLLVLWGLSQFI